MPDLSGRGTEENDVEEKHFPDKTCSRCPSYLLCLTANNFMIFGMEERHLLKCSKCGVRILFYPDGRNNIDKEGIGTHYEDTEGGQVLRGCLLNIELYKKEHYLCPACRYKARKVEDTKNV